jgi:hypothetical protein
LQARAAARRAAQVARLSQRNKKLHDKAARQRSLAEAQGQPVCRCEPARARRHPGAHPHAHTGRGLVTRSPCCFD